MYRLKREREGTVMYSGARRPDGAMWKICVFFTLCIVFSFVLYHIYYEDFRSRQISLFQKWEEMKVVEKMPQVVFGEHLTDVEVTLVTVIKVMDPNLYKAVPDCPMNKFLLSLRSWLAFFPAKNIIIVTSADLVCNYIEVNYPGVLCYPLEEGNESNPCANKHFGKNELGCIFNMLQADIETPYTMYLNGDIVLTHSFIHSMEYVLGRITRPVLVGRRHDLYLANPLKALEGEDWIHALEHYTLKNGELHSPYAVDYFFMPTNVFRDLRMPPFLAGVYRWDCWLIIHLLSRPDVEVVDMTETALIVHLSRTKDMPSTPHEMRVGAVYNNDLILKLLPKSIQDLGRVDNVKTVLKSTAAPLSTRKPREGYYIASRGFTKELLSRILHKKGAGNQIVLLFAGSDNAALVNNWVCWARAVDYHHFIVIAEDDKAFQSLSGMLSTDELLAVDEIPLLSTRVDYTSVAYQQVMLNRIAAIQLVAKSGLSVMRMDPSSVWLADPWTYLEPRCDITGLPIANKRLSGGMLVVHPTLWSKELLQNVRRCQEKNIELIRENRPDVAELAKNRPFIFSDMHCWNVVLSRAERSRQPRHRFTKDYSKLEVRGAGTNIVPNMFGNTKHRPVRVCAPPPLKYPSGQTYFEDSVVQMEGAFPSIIQNHRFSSPGDRIQLFKDHGLWRADLGAPSQCVATPPHTPPRIPPKASPFKLGIAILAYDKPKLLSQVLASLSEVDYRGQRVKLTVSVDGCKEGGSAAQRERVVDIVGKFVWAHGEKVVYDRKVCMGALGQWLHAYDGHDNQTQLMVVEEGVSVSPLTYIAASSAYQRYVVKADGGDARMMGFGLEYQGVVAGVVGSSHQSFKGSLPAFYMSRVRDSDRIYFYQLPSLAPVLLPAQYQHYRRWVMSKLTNPSPYTMQGERTSPDKPLSSHRDIGFVPCVPLSEMNKVYIKKADAMPSIWMARYMFDKGMYFGYLRGEKGSALAVRQGEPVLPLHKDAAKNVPLARKAKSDWFDSQSYADLDTVTVFDQWGLRLRHRHFLSFRPVLYSHPRTNSLYCSYIEDQKTILYEM